MPSTYVPVPPESGMVIADLIEDHNLVIYCQKIRCRRSVHQTRAEAIERFGASYSLAAIRDRGR
ncbi:hypothetical protein JQW92_21030 [Sulfitobacter pseudonitzschiae]|nr:hypothetical protein [Pseudosulfitobacter pseudonitzschiae]MBM1834570.1 hypothetical protein [Pseudosulfitobacter pseudonitzschiae]MBM1839435.1 hypothetical protein [Pseudosulfitobacter pseudonitzschiae]MBM1844286.1 hypothetical protein [Pseudosulfitobacter pseudonitzschiae]MBM1849120.1 hypothetical protein [Pseudosulfitobacter pseudonitzschiae]